MCSAVLEKLGFHYLVEAAWGADFVAYLEAQELAEKKFLTSSCCPAFVSFIKKNYPSLKENISHNLSPMAHMAMLIKKKNPNAKIIFIGPCIAKKAKRVTAPRANTSTARSPLKKCRRCSMRWVLT